MSLSPPTKETFLAHPPSPLSSQAHLSPRLLTPDSDSFFRKSDTLVFTKQPIPRKHLQPSLQRYSTTESEASDGHISEAHPGGGSRPPSPVKAHHISLLTAILSSPDTALKQPANRGEFKKMPSHNLSGMISGGSNPSTTMSSPVLKEPHGILQHTPSVQQQPEIVFPHASILRRESLGAGGEQAVAGSAMGLGLGASVGVAVRMDADARHSGLDGLAGRLQKVEEKRERIGWADKMEKVTPVVTNLARVPSATSSTGPCRPRLQFAVAHPPSHGSTSASEAGEIPGRRVSSTTSHHPNDPFAKERKVQESLDEQSSDANEGEEEEDEDDEEAGDTPLEDAPRFRGYNSRSTSSSGRRSSEIHSPIDEEDDEDDLGYLEDEEDGMFSDEEETTAFDLPGHLSKGKFAFARPTNYFRGRRPSRDDISPVTTPPPAPSYFPPPNRRGRGHVRVADPVPMALAVEKTERKGCTRHCSPPPNSRSRSGSKAEAAPPAIASPSARFMKRPEMVAGPSKQRIVGSPMPPRVMAQDEDEDDDEGRDDEEEEEDKETPPVVRGGWRSDDALFHGPNAKVRLPSQLIRPYDQPRSRNISAPAHRSSVFEDDSADDQSVSFSMAREASMEAIVGHGVLKHWVRRESELPIFRRPSVSTAPETQIEHSSRSVRSREVSFSATIPSSSLVPPALDSTPISGSSFTMDMREGAGVATRLEQTLSISPGPSNSRTPSASSRLSAPLPLPVSNSSSRSVSSSRAPINSLNRTVSLSGRVTFEPTDKPIRNIAPHRAVSHSAHHLSGQKVGAGPTQAQTPVPIRCPKRAQGQKEDLGWSDEALMSIRRKAGKGEDI